MINNFIKHGINPNNIDILVAWNPNDDTSNIKNVEAWYKLALRYNAVRFFFYQDTRPTPIQYISSVRPNVLKQHFQAHPELKDEAIFYCDCDVVFTKTPDWSKFLEDDTWYLSNTNSYINYDYVVSKGVEFYDKMCEIVKIDPRIPKIMNSNSGGAQYILKNVDASFWEKVERDCERLYSEITLMINEKLKEDPKHHPLQIWCADMWAVLWNGWLFGNETRVVPEMDFSWATDSVNKWEETTIFHNAGVTCSCTRDLFYKAKYISRLPYNNIDLSSMNKNSCSYKYVEEILETAAKSCLI
jgi:hypothetical protein